MGFTCRSTRPWFADLRSELLSFPGESMTIRWTHRGYKALGFAGQQQPRRHHQVVDGILPRLGLSDFFLQLRRVACRLSNGPYRTAVGHRNRIVEGAGPVHRAAHEGPPERATAGQVGFGNCGVRWGLPFRLSQCAGQESVPVKDQPAAGRGRAEDPAGSEGKG